MPASEIQSLQKNKTKQNETNKTKEWYGVYFFLPWPIITYRLIKMSFPFVSLEITEEKNYYIKWLKLHEIT